MVDLNEQRDSLRTSNKRGRSSDTKLSGEPLSSGNKSRHTQVRLNSKEPSELSASGKGLAVEIRQESLPDTKKASNPQRRSQPVRVVKRPTGCIVTDHTEAHLAQVATTIAASATSGDMFSMLAVDEIKRQQVLVPSSETLLLPDYKPSQKKYMLVCHKSLEWKVGEQE